MNQTIFAHMDCLLLSRFFLLTLHSLFIVNRQGQISYYGTQPNAALYS
jgi:hypothetical protein